MNAISINQSLIPAGESKDLDGRFERATRLDPSTVEVQLGASLNDGSERSIFAPGRQLEAVKTTAGGRTGALVPYGRVNDTYYQGKGTLLDVLA